MRGLASSGSPQPAAAGCGDPLLARPRIAETSRVLLRELLAEVPLRCPTRAFGAPALEALKRYHASALRWLERLGAAEELRAEVRALGAWLDEHGAAKAGGRRPRPEHCCFRQKLQELSAEGGLSSRLQRGAEPMALRVIGAVSAEAEAVVAALGQGPGASAGQGEVALEPGGPGCQAVLRYEGDAIRLSAMHLSKLRGLYELQRPPPEPGGAAAAAWEEAFGRRLYVMLRRYVTFIGLDPSEEGLRGGNMHAAAPEPVFAWLKRELGVRCELFASPLNCYFPRFFSAFPDTDAAFGSLGSFFQAGSLPEGSYEVGPPYTEEVLELTARRLLALLQAAGGLALSFVLFVPDWEGCGGLEILGGQDFAAFRRPAGGPAFALARGREHHYVSGVQFFADVGSDAQRRYYVVPHGTRVYVLQSAAGAERWPFGDAQLRALLERMRPPAQP
mmetsp:Transcript_17545/g.53144  ORF Transcript_17545/g.53144 Transcript_17545/m.53144 type:complete len:447 (-) Transcript_17545:22-1362(-)